jgi:penicillin-binding protein 1A
VAAVALAGAVAGIAFASAIRMPRIEALSELTPALITEIRDRNGEVFGSFSLERRILLEEGEVPPLLQNALLASEDQNFFEHGGVDPLAILRAQIANWRAGEISEGASTLTMQLAREIFLTKERTWKRKIAEALYAVELEKNLSKQQILTLYLNLVNVGNGNYGMAAAARDYFGKDVADLTLPEAATLVGILPAPSRYNPYRKPELVLERRNTVLRRMVDAGYIGREEYEAAHQEPLLLATDEPKERLAPYFAEEARKYLDATYGTDAVVHGGLQVTTTLDPAIQRAAEDALRSELARLDHRKGWRGPLSHLEDEDLEAHELPSWSGDELVPGRWVQGIVLRVDRSEARVKIQDRTFQLTGAGMRWTRRSQPSRILKTGDVAWFRLEAPEEGKEGGKEEEQGEPRLMLEQEPELEGAAVVLESATGAVRAMVGGWSFRRSKFNRATQAERQVGSAFKPFVFGAALETGLTPADTLFDGPTYFAGSDNLLTYHPRNYYREYLGILTLRRALELSINVTSVKLLDLVGAERVVDFAHRMGIRAELPPYPSLALGSAEITPLDLATGYATLANQGTWVEPYYIERVEMPGQRVLEEHIPNTRAATDQRIAYVLTHMLEGVVDRGTGTRVADLDLDLAGKTGTTDDYSDAWFVGFTPRYTVLTWVGYNEKRSIGRNMTGAEAALPMWRKIVERGLTEGWIQAGERFPVPPGVTLQPVEYFTGLLPGPSAERVIDEAFVEGTEPVQEYTPRWGEVMELAWYQQRPFYIPKEGEKMPVGWRDASGEVVELDEESLAALEAMAEEERLKKAGG